MYFNDIYSSPSTPSRFTPTPSHPTLPLALGLAQWFVCLFYRYREVYGAQVLLGVRPAMECGKLPHINET